MKIDVWAATAPAELQDAKAPTHRSPLLNAKVMMVDDEPLMTDLIQAHLEEEGYANFVVTNDPRQALEILRAEEPGVLLLDLMMPGISGFDLLEAIRADRALRYTPVIVLTAAGGADARLRALRLGATDFLSKPVDASELVLRVRNTLAFHQYHTRLANFDAVSGLPNERGFDRGVDEILSRLPLSSGLVALLIVTVPECQSLRANVDQACADGLAKVIARRLDRFLVDQHPPPALSVSAERAPRAARLGTDQFAVLLEGLVSVEAVEVAGRRLLAVLSETATIGLHEVGPTVWIGIALAPDDGNSAHALRKDAELASLHAREAGVLQVQFASAELNAKSRARVRLGSQLRGAAQRGELRLHYQPKVDVASGRIAGVEALVRWHHPDQGLIPPGDFIPLAEELGLIIGIGEWVMQQACRDAASWRCAGLGNVKVAVNVSKPQFMAGNLCQVVSAALLATSLEPAMLVVELTESMLMTDVSVAIALMTELKELGVALSIDDFGTGYSSLSYLKQFPLDELKIDRSFIMDLPGRTGDLAIARAIVDLGHSLGMHVTAEGVETVEQLHCLQGLGCDTYQGFFFSKPLPAERMMALLSSHGNPL